MAVATTLERYTIRPATMADIPAVVELENLCSIEQIGKPEIDAEEIRLEWETPGFDPATDTRLIHALDGTLVGMIEVWDTSEPHVNLFSHGRTHPEYRGLGIGTALMEWAEQRAREAFAKAPADAQVTLGQGTINIDTLAADLFQVHGYNLARHFWRMEIELDSAPTAVQLPNGITIRAYDPATELPAVVQAARDSFQDHWGYVAEPFAKELEKWQQYIRGNENYDPTLFFVALDGDQYAGISMCWRKTTEDLKMGWVGTLGVGRSWRRSGLGLALLLHSFNEFYARGQERVGLGVDASSLTGATRLYEKAGMRATRQWDRYEKVLRPGVDLRTQTVD